MNADDQSRGQFAVCKCWLHLQTPRVALYSMACVSALNSSSQQKPQSDGRDVISEGWPADQRCSTVWCQWFESNLDLTNSPGSTLQFVFFGLNQSGKVFVWLSQLHTDQLEVDQGLCAKVIFYLLDRVLVRYPASLVAVLGDFI